MGAQGAAHVVGLDVDAVLRGSPQALSTRISTSAPHTSSRASLCGVPGSTDSNASVHSAVESQTSAHGVSTSMPSAGGRSENRTAGSIAATSPADALSRATSGSASARAVAPSGTRSRSVQVCTPSSPRPGSTSATYAR